MQLANLGFRLRSHETCGSNMLGTVNADPRSQPSNAQAAQQWCMSDKDRLAEQGMLISHQKHIVHGLVTLTNTLNHLNEQVLCQV